MLSLICLDKDDSLKNDKICDALLVLPDPDWPVRTIDCNLSLRWIILLATNDECESKKFMSANFRKKAKFWYMIC